MKNGEGPAIKLVKSLVARYKVVDQPLMGKVVVVPAERFESKWYQQLRDENITIHDAGDFVYVKIPNAAAVPKHTRLGKKSEKTLAPETRRRINWIPEEDKLLIVIAEDKELTVDEICAKFFEQKLEQKKKDWPYRSEVAVVKHVAILRTKGDIPHKRPLKEAKQEEATTGEESTPSAEKAAESPIKQVSLEKMAEGVKKDEGFSAIVFDQEQLLMQLRRKDVEKWRGVLKAVLGDSS